MNAQNGVTLLEAMLVLAIAASMLVIGIRVYDQFRFQANEQKVMANVNLLFQTLRGFYFANCRQVLAPTSGASPTPQTPGALDPDVADSSGGSPLATQALNIQDDLITTGFLPAEKWRPVNPLLDKTPDKSYYIQFNRVLSGGADPAMTVFACTGDAVPPSCNTTSGTVLSSSAPPSGQSRVVIWTIQVAVKLAPNLSKAQWEQIRGDLRADCISTFTGTGVTPCGPSVSRNGYLVWTRLPSAYDADSTSQLWMLNPSVQQFNRQYTNDPMATLSGVTNEAGVWYNPFNYLCGG